MKNLVLRSGPASHLCGLSGNAWNPVTLFDGVVNGGLYVASSPGNTLSQWNDTSGLGNHLTQAVSANRFDEIVTGYNGKTAYLQYDSTALSFFNLPSLTINRRSLSLWCISRTRSNRLESDSIIAAFGSGLTDCFVGWGWNAPKAAPSFRAWGTSLHQANSNILFSNSSVTLTIASADASGVTAVQDLSAASSLAAFDAGTVTGGRMFCRNDPGYPLFGEIYEFGLLDRTLTPTEIGHLQDRFRSLYNPKSKLGQVVVIGDSLTESQNGQRIMSWPTAVDNAIGSDYTMRNMGTGATYITNQWAPTSSNHFDPAGLYNAALSKNIFICWLGTNDITSSVSAADIKAAIHAVTDVARAAGFKVIVCTIIPRNDDASWNTNPAFEATRLALNAALIADTGFDAVVDLASVSQLSNPNNATYFSTDKLHLVDAGYQVVADTIRPVITSF